MTNNSHVISALPELKKYASNSLRLSFGRKTTKREIKKTIIILGKIVKELEKRQASVSK